MRQSFDLIFGAASRIAARVVDLVGVASGNYVAPSAETTVSQLYALMDRDMAVEERGRWRGTLIT